MAWNDDPGGWLQEGEAPSAGSFRWPVVEEFFECSEANPEWMDALWSQGWRHFGIRFFRYSVSVHDGQVVQVVPLRIDLARWKPSRSQTRILRRNNDLEVEFVCPELNGEHGRLFRSHVRRFTSNIPHRLEDFLGPDPGRIENPRAYPCACVEVRVRSAGRLVAASYLDVGRTAASSVYGLFDPVEGRRSLGIATLLWEIEYARAHSCRYLYPGYVYASASVYDYKKRLGALEAYDWNLWRPWEPEVEPAGEDQSGRSG